MTHWQRRQFRAQAKLVEDASKHLEQRDYAHAIWQLGIALGLLSPHLFPAVEKPYYSHLRPAAQLKYPLTAQPTGQRLLEKRLVRWRSETAAAEIAAAAVVNAVAAVVNAAVVNAVAVNAAVSGAENGVENGVENEVVAEALI